jgi:hypothetical protein
MDKLAEAEPTRLPDPSPAQVRAAVTEFGILPLGSQSVKDHAPLNMTLDPKTGDPKGKPKPTTPLLIVGAPGTGKRCIVNAIANETGANLFNLTPSNTDGKYSKKCATSANRRAATRAAAAQLPRSRHSARPRRPTHAAAPHTQPPNTRSHSTHGDTPHQLSMDPLP